MSKNDSPTVMMETNDSSETSVHIYLTVIIINRRENLEYVLNWQEYVVYLNVRIIPIFASRLRNP
jgi:hypothetical protein